MEGWKGEMGGERKEKGENGKRLEGGWRDRKGKWGTEGEGRENGKRLEGGWRESGETVINPLAGLPTGQP
jgi:hypothetical protein